jgi:hypothetical protein
VSPRPLRFDDLPSTVARSCPAGHPLVLRCRPLRVVAGRPLPFPTLYWLACPEVARAIARLEHQGFIERLERELRDDAGFRAEVAHDHAAYAAEREAALSEEERRLLASHGLLEPLRVRGIGGSRAFDRLKCLHLHYAHHLARGSAVGRRLDAIASIRPCGGGDRG